jgi:hypothetical protein
MNVILLKNAHKIFIGSLKGRDPSEDKAVDGRKLLKWIVKKSGGVVNWIHMAQNRDRLRALVKVVMNLCVS